MEIIKKIFGYCKTCSTRTGKKYAGWFKYPYTQRQATAYCDDTRNFFTGCKECHQANDDHWNDMWENCS